MFTKTAAHLVSTDVDEHGEQDEKLLNIQPRNLAARACARARSVWRGARAARAPRVPEGKPPQPPPHRELYFLFRFFFLGEERGVEVECFCTQSRIFFYALIHEKPNIFWKLICIQPSLTTVSFYSLEWYLFIFTMYTCRSSWCRKPREYFRYSPPPKHSQTWRRPWEPARLPASEHIRSSAAWSFKGIGIYIGRKRKT